MTPVKKQLDDLFQRVANDTPSIERNELRSMLEQHPSGTLPVIPVQTLSITKDRRRGFIKGIFIMTLIGVFITAILLLFSSHETTHSVQDGISASTGGSFRQLPTNTAIPQQKTDSLNNVSSSDTKDSAFHSLTFEPINLTSVTPIPIGSNDLSKIGLLKDEQGQVIMYHADTKVIFPTYEPTGSGMIEKDDRAIQFKDLAIHPSYATDSKGNLLMIYKYVKDSNSTLMNLSLLDDAERMKQALSSNYFPSRILTQQGGDLDSTGTPWIVKNVKYQFSVGIMTLDTVMTDIFHERHPSVDPIFQRLTTKDSLYKMQFGGEAGLKVRFQFPTEGTKLSPVEKKILDSLGKIESRIPERKKMLELQLHYLGSLIKGKYPDTLKLELEQLSHKIGYEEYLLEHQEQQKTLKTISSLVPISVRQNTGMKKDNMYDNGLIFWYEPSEELFHAVPQARERAAVDNTLFHTSDDVKNVVLYPNPASLYLFVSYSVSQRATVNMSILDLLGRTVAENISSHIVPSGDHKESISLGNIPPGIYLVLIRTDNGQQSIHRLIIEK